MIRIATIALLAAAFAAAAIGWSRGRPPLPPTPAAQSIRIVDVQPLRTSDPNLRDLLAHHLAVRVRKTAARWSLYVDGQPFDESTAPVLHTPYLTPGTHWIAARLQRGGGVWSEPVVLHVPRVMRCWQTGWDGGAETGTPRFRCRR
jgi:hypothetical protein